ncbi:MAG: GNAT family N-acetyltransferase [Hyphomicrobiaceae bacterium]|nr:GNAT family N-acetyltransferase [Hyphomicrobiaceae bacterium]
MTSPIPSPPPTLDTERLQLRAFNSEDAGPAHTLAGDRDVAKMTRTIPHPYTQADAERWIDATSHLMARGLLRQHAITRVRDGQLMGNLTLRKRHAGDAQAELSFWLGKPFWGHGYIAEAARIALFDGMTHFGLTSVRAAALEGNPRSARVLEKLGFIRDGEMEVYGLNWDGKAMLRTYLLTLPAGLEF